MKGLFIPGITAKMFRDASVESVAELMADGKIYDIDYQEPKMGRWVVAEAFGFGNICECSKCKESVWIYKDTNTWNYCPKCGIKMEGKNEATK